MHAVYDIETYPNYFLLGAIVDGDVHHYEISERRDDFAMLAKLVDALDLMIGFNNIGFDYPVLHNVLWQGKYSNNHSPALWWPKVQQIFTDERFVHRVPRRNWLCKQLDLFLIHHFDHPAKRTSLKTLQFVMRSDYVQDLPIAPGTVLTHDQMDLIKDYNIHDLRETEKLFHKSKEAVDFRKELGDDYMNANDVRIGVKYVVDELEKLQPGICYTRDRTPRQTLRLKGVPLRDVIFPYVKFQHSGFRTVLDTLRDTVVVNTKSEHQIETIIDGLTLSIGTGGMHAGVKKAVIESSGGKIWDLDVGGYYPSLGIANKLYPEHLGMTFCDFMAKIKAERAIAGKKSFKGRTLKLAGNGVFGNTNEKHSPFFDPKYMLATTINGQLLLAMLIEPLLPYVRIIQINTDGITIQFPAAHELIAGSIAKQWEAYTCLSLEIVEYKKMWIRDVNNYIAQRTDGTLKRKGVYEYENLELHKNHNALVVKRAAEAAMVHGIKVEEFIHTWTDPYDFMLLAKGPRIEPSGTRHLRYYVSTSGVEIFKIMPPLTGKTAERRISISKKRKCTPCNQMPKRLVDVDYDFYIQQARKLVI